MIDFETFYNTYHKKAFVFALKKMQNSHDAEDLVHECFLYCYKHYSDYDETKASLGTWLYLILNSRIKNYYRDRKMHLGLSAVDSFIDPEESDQNKAIELEEMREQIADGLEALPQTQKQIVIYRYFRQYSTRETADILGISEINVRVQLTRALKKMRMYIKE